MATRFDVIRRPGVQLIQEEPMSALDSIASALGDYYSPEEIRARKSDRRADARVRLEQDRFDELKEQTDFSQEQTRIANKRQAALDKRQTTVFNQGQEDREFNIAKENYDHTLNTMLKDKDVEGALEFLNTFNTSNARLSALAKQEAKNLGRKKTQLTSAINDLSTIAPGLTERYSTASLMKTLWDNPNAIAETIMLSEIGEITKGKEKEYESRKVILNSQLAQLKTALAGSPERAALLAEIEDSISGIREYGGIGIPGGGGGEDLLGDVTDLISEYDPDRDTEAKLAGFDFSTLFEDPFLSPEEKRKKASKVERAREKNPKYMASKIYSKFNRLSNLKDSITRYGGGKRKSKQREIDKLESEIEKYVKRVYNPKAWIGFKDKEVRESFKKRFPGNQYNELLKYFDSFFPEHIKEKEMRKKFGAFNPDAVTGWQRLMEEIDTQEDDIPSAWLEPAE